MTPPPGRLTVRGLVLVFGAGAMIAQVLILRELLVLAQGQELKLALGLWGWLLWAGLGSLAGGRLHPPVAPGVGPGRLGGLAGAPGAAVARHHPGEPGPAQSGAPAPGPIPAPGRHLSPLLAPAGSRRVYFRLLFPRRGPGPVFRGPPKSRGAGLLPRDPGRGPGGPAAAALSGGALRQPEPGPGGGPGSGPGALAPGPAPVQSGPGGPEPQSPGAGRGARLRPPVGPGQPQLGVARAAGAGHRGQPVCPPVGSPGSGANQLFCQ